MRMFGKRKLVALAVTVVATVGAVAVAPAAATAETRVVSALDIVNALYGVYVRLSVPSVADHDSAAQTEAVDIPIDPRRGVNVRTGDGKTITIGLPDAVNLGNGTRTESGVVYANSNGSDIMAVPTVDGVQFLTIIYDSSAPEAYAYPVAQGGNFRIASNGSAIVLDDTGKPVSVIAAPWAYSQNGKVATSFATNGKTLTQNIKHRAARADYPVVADPYVTWQAINFTLWYGKQEVKNIVASGYWSALGSTVAVACAPLKAVWAIAACTFAINAVWAWINQNFVSAAASNQCAWISVSYGADLDGWGRCNC